MTIGVSLVLIAVGAILVWGVSAEAEGLDVDAIGVILMIVGFVGALLSMIFWSEWSPVYRGARRQVVVEEEEVAPPAAPPSGPPPP
jgi:hypothetical protein